MKIVRSKSDSATRSAGLSVIQAAKSLGTKFYRCTLDNILSALENSKDANIWVVESIRQNGLDALNIESGLFGSKIIDNILYICRTDGKDITIDGESIDPEKALNLASIDQLSEYIEDADDKFIVKNITEYEVNFRDIDKLGQALLDQGHGCLELLKAAAEIDLILQ